MHPLSLLVQVRGVNNASNRAQNSNVYMVIMEKQRKNSNGKFLTREEVASLFGVSKHTVTRWAREGLLSHVLTRGGQYRFLKERIETELKVVRGQRRER